MFHSKNEEFKNFFIPETANIIFDVILKRIVKSYGADSVINAHILSITDLKTGNGANFVMGKFPDSKALVEALGSLRSNETSILHKIYLTRSDQQNIYCNQFHQGIRVSQANNDLLIVHTGFPSYSSVDYGALLCVLYASVYLTALLVLDGKLEHDADFFDTQWKPKIVDLFNELCDPLPFDTKTVGAVLVYDVLAVLKYENISMPKTL